MMFRMLAIGLVIPVAQQISVNPLFETSVLGEFLCEERRLVYKKFFQNLTNSSHHRLYK